MWLLHTSTRKLRSFEGSSIPPYAILSHTWSADEVLFQHMQKPSKYDPLSKQGYSKIELACTQAQNDGYDYIWIDTCCIDKRSSAELSEAIKSIFRWYQEAAICYAYLADVPPGDGIESDYPVFRHSRWFTRGWTLQELIAPSKVTFFAKDWTDIGNRNDLSKVITEITGVDSSVLKGSPFDHLSVARRMSWAARRETTREEDIAYCLFGLFGVNMPLSYGEGKGAFIKLEEEILKKTDDHTLLAWGYSDQSSPKDVPAGVLADSPRAFEHSADVVPWRYLKRCAPSAMTNRGLRVDIPPFLVSRTRGKKEFAMLQCCRDSDLLQPLQIPLIRATPSTDSEFFRAGTRFPDTVQKSH